MSLARTPSELELLQLDCGARLEADAFFTDITVTVMRPRVELGFVQLQERVDQALGCLVKKNGKGGAAVMILMPTLDSDGADSPGPLSEAQLVVRVQELPVHNMGPNGTQKSVEEIALNVVRVLHHFHRGRGNVVFADADMLSPSAEAAPKVTIDVRLRQKIGLPYDNKVAPVTLASAAAVSPATGWTVTLSCATASSSIVYSIDGSYPTLPYTVPFNVPAAATVRAAAAKSGLQQSDLRQLVLA